MLKIAGKGIIVKHKLLQNKHKLIHILSQHGRWQGIYASHTHSITLLTTVDFTWTGNNIEVLGKHECMNLEHFLPNERENQETYMISLVLCELAMCIPERQACEMIWNHFQYSRELLNKGLHMEAWMHFEAALIGLELSETDIMSPKTFLTHSTQKLHAQYDNISFLKMRNYLYNMM